MEDHSIILWMFTTWNSEKMRYETNMTYFLFTVIDFFFITPMFVYMQKLLHCLMIYSYKTNPSFLPCPWNLRSIGPSDFYILFINISFIWRHHHCWWEATQLRPSGLRVERDFIVSHRINICYFIWWTTPFSHLTLTNIPMWLFLFFYFLWQLIIT